MNKISQLSFFVFLLMLVGCQDSKTDLKSISDQDIKQNLTGYWKISEVERPEFNDIREYKFSNTAEYIEVDSQLHGFRIKLEPKLDSTYKTSSKPEKFIINRKNDSIQMRYETPIQDSWTETLVNLKKDQFTVENERGFLYTYKRFESLKKELEQHEEMEE